MSESVEQGAEVAASGPTAGALLAYLRESAGVHIDALAGALKVPVGRLEALEADRYDSFPDAVFMRALAASVCRVLKADPAPVLALLPHGEPARLRAGEGINATFKDQGRRSVRGGTSLDQPKPRLLGIAVAVLLVAALAIAFLPKGILGGSEEQAGAEAPAAPAPVTLPGQVDASQARPDAPQESTPGPAAEAASAAAAPAAPAASQPAAEAQSSANANAAADGVLVIRARAPSWIQVRGASGAVVLEKTLVEGESVSAPGNAPWAVVIGRADATDVTVRGQPLDMRAIARSNVARFEVK